MKKSLWEKLPNLYILSADIGYPIPAIKSSDVIQHFSSKKTHLLSLSDNSILNHLKKNGKEFIVNYCET